MVSRRCIPKIIAVIVAMMIAVGMCGCTTKLLTVKQSKKNFAVYQAALEKAVTQYGLSLEPYERSYTYKDDDESRLSERRKEFLIRISDEESIFIQLGNSAIKSETGREMVYIKYTLSENKNSTEYNVPLFVDLVNCVSGRLISEEFCNEFLEAPESKYSAARYGFHKLNGELVAKGQALNFFEDWVIYYIVDSEQKATLKFSGLTKQLTE